MEGPSLGEENLQGSIHLHQDGPSFFAVLICHLSFEPISRYHDGLYQHVQTRVAPMVY